jgi:hypothetical protein
MKKILFLLFFLSSTSALASPLDDIFCGQSDKCKKYCQLRSDDKYNESNPAHEEMLIECTQELSSKKENIDHELMKNIEVIVNMIKHNCKDYYSLSSQGKITNNNRDKMAAKCLQKLFPSQKSSDEDTIEVVAEVLRDLGSYTNALQKLNSN